jgi:hypothetical protein
MNQFRELQEAIAVLQDRFDNLASFFGTKIKDLEGELRYWRGVLEGQRLAEVPAFPGAKAPDRPRTRPRQGRRVLDELGSSR